MIYHKLVEKSSSYYLETVIYSNYLRLIIIKHPDGVWATRREGAGKISDRHQTQKDAIGAARDRAIRDRVEVVIHGVDGRIRDKDSYGNDPHPPHDTKHY